MSCFHYPSPIYCSKELSRIGVWKLVWQTFLTPLSSIAGRPGIQTSWTSISELLDSWQHSKDPSTNRTAKHWMPRLENRCDWVVLLLDLSEAKIDKGWQRWKIMEGHGSFTGWSTKACLFPADSGGVGRRTALCGAGWSGVGQWSFVTTAVQWHQIILDSGFETSVRMILVCFCTICFCMDSLCCLLPAHACSCIFTIGADLAW